MLLDARVHGVAVRISAGDLKKFVGQSDRSIRSLAKCPLRSWNSPLPKPEPQPLPLPLPPSDLPKAFPTACEVFGEVVYVVDADTMDIVCANPGWPRYGSPFDTSIPRTVRVRVRLLRVDAAEKETPQGIAAAWWVALLLWRNQWTVHVRFDKKLDKNGRCLAELVLPSGENLNDLVGTLELPHGLGRGGVYYAPGKTTRDVYLKSLPSFKKNPVGNAKILGLVWKSWFPSDELHAAVTARMNPRCLLSNLIN